MKPARALWLLTLSIVGTGCALVEDAGRNFCVALKTPLEIHRERVRNEKWAENSWQMICEKDGPAAHSADFAHGFKDGFAEYLFRGGDGEPPLVAPLKYRDIRYQNPAGYRAIQDWFDGFRLGAVTARDSGARQWITGPSSLGSAEFHETAPPLASDAKLPPTKLVPELVASSPPPVLPTEPVEPKPEEPARVEIPAAPGELQPVTPAKAETPAAPIARPAFGAPAMAPLEVKARITNVNVPSSDSPEPDRSNIVQAPENTTDAPRVRIKTITPPRPE